MLDNDTENMPSVQELVNELTSESVSAFLGAFNHQCYVCKCDVFNLQTNEDGGLLYTADRVAKGFKDDKNVSLNENRYTAPIINITCTTCGAIQRFSSVAVADSIYRAKTKE